MSEDNAAASSSKKKAAQTLGPEAVSYRYLWLYSLPAICAVALEPIAEIIDTAILGQVESQWIAALAASHAFLGSFAWAFNFLSHGISTAVARRFGAGKLQEVGPQVWLGIKSALLIGGVFVLLLMLGRDWLLSYVLGADASLMAAAKPYWNIRVCAYPLTLLSFVLLGVLRGMQKLGLSLFSVALSTTLNGVLTYFAVLKWQLGIAGAAWATVFSIFAANGFVLFWMARNRDLLGLSWCNFKSQARTCKSFATIRRTWSCAQEP